MKKIFIGIVLSIMLCLFLDSSPITVKAEDYYVGQVVVEWNNNGDTEHHIADIYVKSNIVPEWLGYSGGYFYATYYGSYWLYYRRTWFDDSEQQVPVTVLSGYMPSLYTNYSWDPGFSDGTRYFYNDYDTFVANLPPDLQEPPSLSEQVWDSFYDLFELVFGYRPQPGSIIDLLKQLALGDDTEDTEIIFPTMTPSPTPTPTPTPIPVQTIFVPDGNGNTTIIYQYPDPTTGVITQSPYNPNINNNIEVNCDCDGGSGGDSNPFSSSPQDPYTLDASLFWADGFGVQMSDNPLSAADDSQNTLKGAAEEYTSSIEVMSNSFNILPVKWITLVGLLGGILILAGLLRTFLGG